MKARHLLGLAPSLLLPLALLGASRAAAHPEHYGQAAYVTLERGRVTVQLELSPGPLVAGRVVRVIDVNGDQQISQEEERAYTEALLKDVSLEIDGRALMPIVSSAEFPPLSHLATGEGQLHFTFTAALPGLGAGPHRAVFRNNHRIVESAYLAHAFAGGKEVVVLGQTRDALYQELRIDYALDLPLDESGGRTKAVALGLAVLGGLGWVAGLVCRAKP